MSANVIAGNVVADNWLTYEQAALEAGRTPDRADWRVCRSIFIGDTRKDAEETVRRNSLGKNFEYIGGLFDKGLGRKIMKRDPETPDSDTGMDYLMQEQIIHGDLDEVIRRLNALIGETGDFGTLVLMGYDWDDKQSWVKSMKRFVDDVIPALG